MVRPGLGQVVVHDHLHVLLHLARHLGELARAHVQEPALHEIIPAAGTILIGWNQGGHDEVPTRLLSAPLDDLLESLVKDGRGLDASFVEPLRVVVRDRLLGRPGDRIVMHEHADRRIQLIERIASRERLTEKVLHLPRALKEGGHQENVVLLAWPRREVTPPIRLKPIRVREEIVRLGWKGEIGAALLSKVLIRRRIEDVHARVLVHVMNELVQVLEPDVRVIPLEVRAHEKHDVLAKNLSTVIQRLFDEVVHPAVHIVVLQALVVLDGVARARVEVEAEAGRGLVVPVGPDLSQDRLLAPKSLRGSPKHLRRLLQQSLRQVGVV
mmetsp:Transcript_13742/g.34523  ORF Transcript_13742/g.34523 Transcript_13742/m.34523 type:complete len:326 (-) Transcript_13742:10-987(-)